MADNIMADNQSFFDEAWERTDGEGGSITPYNLDGQGTIWNDSNRRVNPSPALRQDQNRIADKDLKTSPEPTPTNTTRSASSASSSSPVPVVVEKKRRNRRKKILTATQQQQKRTEALDRNKRSAAKCRAKQRNDEAQRRKHCENLEAQTAATLKDIDSILNEMTELILYAREHSNHQSTCKDPEGAKLVQAIVDRLSSREDIQERLNRHQAQMFGQASEPMARELSDESHLSRSSNAPSPAKSRGPNSGDLGAPIQMVSPASTSQDHPESMARSPGLSQGPNSRSFVSSLSSPQTQQPALTHNGFGSQQLVTSESPPESIQPQTPHSSSSRASPLNQFVSYTMENVSAQHNTYYGVMPLSPISPLQQGFMSPFQFYDMALEEDSTQDQLFFPLQASGQRSPRTSKGGIEGSQKHLGMPVDSSAASYHPSTRSTQGPASSPQLIQSSDTKMDLDALIYSGSYMQSSTNSEGGSDFDNSDQDFVDIDRVVDEAFSGNDIFQTQPQMMPNQRYPPWLFLDMPQAFPENNSEDIKAPRDLLSAASIANDQST